MEQDISIHVPARGTTKYHNKHLFVGCNFNPRSREGNDEEILKKQKERQQFQSTFPRGERPVLVHNLYLSMVFQSTFPRGERHLCYAFVTVLMYFNPRSREGNDDIDIATVDNTNYISIHVPARGTTASI